MAPHPPRYRAGSVFRCNIHVFNDDFRIHYGLGAPDAMDGNGHRADGAQHCSVFTVYSYGDFLAGLER